MLREVFHISTVFNLFNHILEMFHKIISYDSNVASIKPIVVHRHGIFDIHDLMVPSTGYEDRFIAFLNKVEKLHIFAIQEFSVDHKW